MIGGKARINHLCNKGVPKGKVIIVVCTLVESLKHEEKKNGIDRYRRINHLVIFLVYFM
jgi:hypothetical protein